MRKLISTLFTTIILSINILYGRSVHFIQFNQLSIENGLSQSRVEAVLIDHKGYLWVGTGYGLNRYASGEIKQYFHKDQDTTTISSNEIIYIREDSHNNIWVGTRSGLSLYDPQTDRFIRQRFDKIGHVFAADFLNIGEDLYALGVNNNYNLFKYDPEKKIWYDQKIPAVSREHIINMKSAVIDSTHILFNPRNQGIWSIDLEKSTCERLDYIQPHSQFISIHYDTQGRLWTSQYTKGLDCYENGKLLAHYSSENSPLTNNNIFDIIEYQGNIWAATDGGGICRINPQTGEINSFVYDVNNPNSIPTNATCHLYTNQRNSKELYIGTVNNGLIVMQNVDANSYSVVPFGNPNGITNNRVNQIIQDEKGLVWIATDGEGINCMNTDTGKFKHFYSTAHNNVTSLVNYSNQEILYYAFNKGFFLLNKETGQIRPFTEIDPEFCKAIYNPQNSILMLDYDSDQTIINSSKIYLYHKKKKELTYIDFNKFKRASPTTFDPQGNIYYAGSSSAVFKYSIQDKTSKVFVQIREVNDILHDGKNRLWFATDKGLSYLNLSTNELKRLETPLFDGAQSIILDQHNRIWIGSHNGLFIYSIEEEKFYILNENNGIKKNEFLPYSHCILENGDIMVGGFLGLSHIRSDIQFDNPSNDKIEPFEIKYAGTIISEDSKFIHDKKITVPWDFTSLNISVLLNDGFPLSDNLFKFQIKDKEASTLLEAIDRSTLKINNFPTGKYQIYSSYYTNLGTWSTPQKLFDMEICPPWWKSSWFIFLSILLVLLSTGSAIIAYDKKKKKLQEQEIRENRLKMNEEKVNFMTNISHELRTPLILVCSPLKRILNHEIPSEEIISSLESVYKNANHMKNIIDMVLDVRKYEDGKLVLQKMPYDINQWVQHVVSKFKAEFNYKNIEIHFNLSPKEKTIYFDKNKIEFVLSNFLMNALKFSNEGSSITVSTEFNAENGLFRISVTDQGIGLSMVDLNSIFENFYQGKHDKGGSGIGLAYAKTLISLHNGNIGAYNNSSEGATFYFELPINQKGKGKEINSTKEQDIEQEPFSQEDLEFLRHFSIQIVEDDEELRNYLKETLKLYFNKVYAAPNGQEGYLSINSNQPDIIISDVMMPVMNGFELCKKVKTDIQISHIPFILLTAYSNAQNMNIGYKTGADAFIGKPFEIDSLIALAINNLRTRENIKARFNKGKVEIPVEQICFSNADESFLIKLNEIIDENIKNPEMNVEFLAKGMCVSKSLLFTKLKSLTDMGIVEYVNKRRIEKAAILLKTTDMTIMEISEDVGISTVRYFSKLFKKIKDCSPSQYRKEEKESATNA